MAVDSSIDLRIVRCISKEVASPIETIDKLLKFGWVLKDRNGHVSYLPVKNGGICLIGFPKK